MSASFYRIEKGGLGGLEQKFRDVKVVYTKYPFLDNVQNDTSRGQCHFGGGNKYAK